MCTTFIVDLNRVYAFLIFIKFLIYHGIWMKPLHHYLMFFQKNSRNKLLLKMNYHVDLVFVEK